MEIRVLIIDDEEALCLMYLQAFAAVGIPAMVEHTGKNAVERVRAERPTMILLDIMMPEVDGLQILDSLKSDPELKDIPVMTFTNLSNDKIRELALAKGAVEYIDKSKFKPRQIVARVKAYYDQA